jgi:hypothetical protein
MTNKVTAPASEQEETSYPAAWLFDEDGDTASGTFIKFDRAPTKEYGMKTIAVLQIAEEDRSIWLHWDALFNRFKQEVTRRPGQTLEHGERVIVKKLGLRESKNGRKYEDFEVLFPDRPPPTQAELWGDIFEPVTEPEAGTPELAGEGPEAGAVDEDGIPF